MDVYPRISLRVVDMIVAGKSPQSDLTSSKMVLRHKGYGVYITCDGQPLAEYNFQVEDPLTVSCYVPSEKGKVCATRATALPFLYKLPEFRNSLGGRRTSGTCIASTRSSG